ncbi:hypothetical protein BSKO_10772 [Bryopsis sp. KO-2023]|nr:hypothetical protein BSKO_10772 [Bryopsis sp. KO-2023]
MDVEYEQPVAAPFDIEVYISNYSSHTKVDRLLFIAKKCVGTGSELEALKLAADLVKENQDTTCYSQICAAIAGRLGASYEVDCAWVERVDARAAARQEELEQHLHGFKTNLIKESIRMGYNDLGNFFYERGMLQESFKNYLKTRDYCTTPTHVIHMCLSVMKVSLEMGGYSHLGTYLRKAEQLPEDGKDKIVDAKLNCLAGLKELEAKKYKYAARKFVQVDAELGTRYNDVIAPQDVATYGGLCAMASFDRKELKAKVVDNIGFREFLELVPEVRECIYDFYKSQYASCLANLARMKSSLALDLFLHSHVEDLYKHIRQKALIQYTAPFSSVNLTPMAEAFSVCISDLEKELAALIMENQIKARIDSHKKILYAQHANIRKGTFGRALNVSEQYIRETKALLLRSSLMKHELMQKQSYGVGKRGHGNAGHQAGASAPHV